MKQGLWIWTALALAATPAFGQIDLSAGFGTGTGLQANGNAAFVGGRAQLTPSLASQAGSVYFATKQDVRTFLTSFRFQFGAGSASKADGITFVLHNAALTALGGGGGTGLGYEGILTSVAVKFDIYSAPNSYTGLYTNGATPNTPQTTISPTIDCHNGNIFQADLSYDGTTLDVTITDTVTAATVSQSYAVDIPAVVGADTAYVGFTGATGGSYCLQEVIDWTYISPPPAPGFLNASDDQIGQVTLTWSAVADAVSYNIYRGTAPGGPYVLIDNVPSSTTSYVDTVGRGTYYYVVTAVGTAGESGYSPEDAGTSRAPPRTNDHEEGLLDGDCSCGSRASGAPWLAALAAALALGALRRR